MADLINIRLEGDKAITEGRLFDMIKAKHLLRDAVDDIADAVETMAETFAPQDTGILKLHPVDRDDTRFGVVTGVAAFGGGTSIRGAGGRFVGAGAGTPGELVARSTITVAQKPEYAIWVHNGTGIYGPRKKPYTALTPGKYMTFFYHKGITRKNFRLLSVRGQKAQPYLTNAFLLIERTFMPVRIEHLRAQIAAET